MRTMILLLGVALVPLVDGCANANSAPETTNATPPVAAAEATIPPAAPGSNIVIQAEVPAGRVVSTNFTVPDAVKLSPAATEIAKMARAGVESSVMLTYVANSVNTYNLNADEIVYLNDLGLPPDVVSAMIQHDQQIREASLNGAMAASPATPAPGASVWNAGAVTQTSDVWQKTAAAPAPEVEVQTTVPPPPEEERPAEVTVNYFYDSLAPYGTWIEIDGYGRCWRPTVVATHSGWRPYVNGGRWLWTDDHGWYWYSDYSWGWAPFHYGRWFSHPHWGWCWVPGTVWGPSWVSWRYTDGYCGWAPLPPAAYYAPSIGFSYYGRSCGVGFSFGLTWDYFTFVSYNNFCGRQYDRHRVGRHESAQIYNNSTVINNFIVGNNNTIINQGIAPDRIRAVTRSEVPRTRVNALPGDGGPRGGGRHETLAANGSTLNVTRHEVPGERPPVREGTVRAPAVNTTALAAPPAETRAASPIRSEPARTGGAGSGRNGAPLASTSAASSSPAPAAATAWSPTTRTASPAQEDRPRTGGSLIIREVRTSSAPAPANVQTAPSAATSPNATPWLNNPSPATSDPARSPRSTRQTPTQTSGSQPSTAAAPTRPTRPVPATEPTPATPATPPTEPQPPSVATPATAPTPPGVIRFQTGNPLRSTPRSVEPNTPPTRSSLNPAPTIRNAPTYTAPAGRQPAPTPAPETPRVTQPPPATRIERPSTIRSTVTPTPAPVTRFSTPPAATPSVRSAPSPAPSRPTPAAVPRSAPERSTPSSDGDRDISSRPSRGNR